MGNYFRLAKSKNTLPTHYAYGDAWENGEDCRIEGFQAFAQSDQALMALMGYDMDGFYPAKDYPQLLIIDANEEFVTDGGSMYFAIRKEGIVSVKAIDSEESIFIAESLFEKEKDIYDYQDIRGWLADSEEELTKILLEKSVGICPTFVDTLPNPEGKNV